MAHSVENPTIRTKNYTTPGDATHHRTLGERFLVLGIDPQRARNATLQDLARQVDARSLIDLLGYSGRVVTQHASRAGAPMSDYIDLRRRDGGAPQPTPE